MKYTQYFLFFKNCPHRGVTKEEWILETIVQSSRKYNSMEELRRNENENSLFFRYRYSID